MEKNNGLWIIAVYFFLSIYLLPMYPHGGSPAELTRWATTASIVEKGSFDIGWTEDLIGRELESVRIGDRVFAAQPPGTAVVAIPVYALARLAVGPPNASNIRVTWFAMRFFVATIPLLLLALWLYSHDSDEISLAALLLASPLFVYSLLFSSSVFVAVLLYLAFRLIYDADRIFLRNTFLAGALCGFAVTCEFAALVPVAAFGGGLLFSGRRNRNLRQTLVIFVLGGLPFLALLLVYNWALYGSPVAFQFAAGVGLPEPSNFYLLLFSPSRGLFFFAPLLLLPLVAFVGSRERRTLRHRVKVAAILGTLVLVCALSTTGKVAAFGPQPLALVLPLLLDAFFDGEIYEYSNVWQGMLFTLSFVFCAVPALTFPFAPPEFTFPHNDFWGKLLAQENWFAPTLADATGLLTGSWSIVPAVVALVFALFVVRRTARRPSRFTYGLLAGLLLAGFYFWLPRLDGESEAFRRAALAERHFRPNGRLEVFKTVTDPSVAGRVNEAQWFVADARAFAPDDFPYLPNRVLDPSPSAEIRLSLELARRGAIVEAEEVMRAGKEKFPFARCEFASNLAVLYSTSGRRDDAIAELESIQNLVVPGVRADCARSQFLLGTLYREAAREDRARETFSKFLQNTKDSQDAEIQSFRREITR